MHVYTQFYNKEKNINETRAVAFIDAIDPRVFHASQKESGLERKG